MRMVSLRELGHDVAGINIQSLWDDAGWLSRRIQQRANKGPSISRLNASVIAAAREFKPELVWAEKQEHLEPDRVGAQATLLVLRGGEPREVSVVLGERA